MEGVHMLVIEKEDFEVISSAARKFVALASLLEDEALLRQAAELDDFVHRAQVGYRGHDWFPTPIRRRED